MKKLVSLLLAVLILITIIILGCISSSAAESYLWPVPANTSITSNRGYSSSHKGIDIAGKTSYDIVATKSGTIICAFTGCNNKNALATQTSCNKSTCDCSNLTDMGGIYVCDYGYGRGVVIKHTDGTFSCYGHMSTMSVKYGQTVKQGQIIGKMGNYGYSSGVHLHFSLSSGSWWNYNINNNPSNISYVYGSSYKIAYNANGGTGTMSASTIISNGTLTIPECKFTKDGYYCAGYNCYRKSDNTWYTDTAGWKTNTEIYKNGYTKKLYKPGKAFTFGTAWTNGAPVGDTFTFHAVWLKNKPLISFYDNISGSNYISSSLDNKDIFAVNFVSRDTSIHTLSIDTTETLNNQNSLKIVSTTAGSTSSKDFAIATNTNAGMAEEGKNGDSGNMVMTFYAKSDTEGTQMNLRWGYSSDIHTVTLTTQWKTYSVTMPKTIYYGAFIHGYLDRAATVYMNNIVVAEKYSSSYLQEDGSLPLEIEYNHGETFEELPIPERPGYTFLGWYTKNIGGTQVDIGSQVPLYNTKLYAQWEKTFSQTPASALETLDGKLYECYDNALSWEDAKAHCESLGGHLVTINSEEENTIVLDLIKDSGRFAWIGASYNTTSECWEWVTGEDFEYTNWISGQPSNSQTNPEYYAQMMPFNTGLSDTQGKWNDAMGVDGWLSHYGMKNASYICEYESTEENTEPTYETELPTEPTDITEPTIEPPVPYLPLGDADGDGRVTILDATVIQRHLAQLPNNVFVEICADTDKDGAISILDATMIQRYLANLITEF